MRDVVVDGSALTIDDVVTVARGQARVSLGDDVPQRMEVSRSVVVEALRGDAPRVVRNRSFHATSIGKLLDGVKYMLVAPSIASRRELALLGNWPRPLNDASSLMREHIDAVILLIIRNRPCDTFDISPSRIKEQR